MDSNPNTAWRDRCAELAQQLDSALDFTVSSDTREHMKALVARTRAELTQPEPKELTDEELLRCYGLAKRDHCYEGPIDDWPKRAERAATVAGLRAVLAADRARFDRP
jgi:hypothetical protein